MKTFLSCLLCEVCQFYIRTLENEESVTVLTTLPDLSTTAIVWAIAAAILILMILRFQRVVYHICNRRMSACEYCACGGLLENGFAMRSRIEDKGRLFVTQRKPRQFFVAIGGETL